MTENGITDIDCSKLEAEFKHLMSNLNNISAQTMRNFQEMNTESIPSSIPCSASNCKNMHKSLYGAHMGFCSVDCYTAYKSKNEQLLKKYTDKEGKILNLEELDCIFAINNTPGGFNFKLNRPQFFSENDRYADEQNEAVKQCGLDNLGSTEPIGTYNKDTKILQASDDLNLLY